MDPSFWHERWEECRIGFHEPEPNALLIRHFAKLDLQPGSRIFVPLCGKSHDLGWLLGQGHGVAGVELSRKAVEQLFDELGVTPAIEELDGLTRFSFEEIEVFAGNFFDLTAKRLGPVDAVYDRAALVALPAEMRTRYAAHLPGLTATAPQLLISFDYDQSMADGPPFSVPAGEIAALYGARYRIALLESIPITGNLARRCEGAEETWLLSPK